MDVSALLSRASQVGIQLWAQDGALKYKAPSGALTPELKAEIAANKAEIIAFLQERNQGAVLREPIGRASEEQTFCLSFGQKWLWTVSQLGDGAAEYNIPSAMRLKGPLDIRALTESLNRLVHRHEILRTVYGADSAGEPFQKILPFARVELPMIEISDEGPEAQDSAVKAAIGLEVSLPFDLAEGPVFRAKLFRLSDREHVLLLVFHHIVCDNQSLTNFLGELTAIYPAEVKGEKTRLPELKVRYADYARWQKRALDGNAFDAELSYWREVLDGAEKIPEIGGDFSRLPETSPLSIREYYTMPAEEAAGLKSLSRKLGCSFYVTLLSLYKILLFQYSGNRDIPIGSPVAGRGRAELEPLMGVFFNTVAVCGDSIRPDLSVTEYIGQVNAAASGAFQHQEIPFDFLIRKLGIPVQPNQTPVFSALFNMYGVQYRNEMEGLTIEPFDRSAIGGQNVQSKFDITLLAVEHEEGVHIDFSLKAGLFREETARWLVGQFRALSAAVAEHPEQSIGGLPALLPLPPEPDPLDTDQAAEATRGYAYVPLEDTEQSIVRRFDRQAELFPEKTAVDMNGETLTYRALRNASENLCQFIAQNIDPLPRLSQKEKTRYTRQLALDGWGIETQEKLKGLTVFAAGAGGSGSPVIMQLALMGVGTIIICDFDTIEEPNLNRQFLHDEDRIGMNKAQSAALSVKRVNSHVDVIVCQEKIDRENIDELVGDSAVIFDNVDDLDAKFTLSECAVRKGIPHVISSNIERSSYAAIFHTPYTPCFHCCYDKSRLDTARKFRSGTGDVSRIGNPVAAPPLFVCAGFAVNEAIKIVLGLDNPAYNRYFLFNNQGSPDFSQTQGYKLITYPFSGHFMETCKKNGFDWDSGFSGRIVEEIPIEKDPNCALCGALSAADAPRTPASPTRNYRMSGGEPDVAVILMNQCVGAVAGIMGILRGGYAFAFMPPDYPDERLEYILRDTGAHLILTDDENEELASQLRDRVNRHIFVLNIKNIRMDAPVVPPADDRSGPDQMAYIVYTSGSTGNPKGVTQTHRNVLHYTRNYINGLRIGSGDRLSLIPSLAFSAAMMDIFAALTSGATLCMYDIKDGGPHGLGAWLDQNKISVYHSVPTIFRRFADSLVLGGNLPGLRVIDLGGEPVTHAELALFRERFHPGCVLVNGLGATELNVIAQYKIRSGAAADGGVPVGYPAEDTEVLLLDEDGSPVGFNRPGEIVIRSAYLSPGYWGLAEQTDAAFKLETGGKRLFYTGDMGRRRADGCLYHLGRRDLQLKIRGIRIESLEIESALKALPMVRDAAVRAEEHESGEKYIAAYFVCREDQTASAQEIASHLRETLPEYMIPASFTRLDTMPLTSTGKVDRKRLGSAGGVKMEAVSPFAPPTNAMEEKLTEIWKKALNASAVGIRDDFFDLGGNSLSAIDLVNSVKTATGVSLSILDILRHPTVAEMSRLIVDKN